ncbi:Adenylate cyclase type 10, partial [Dinochytrium kinnereticum]
MKAWECFRRHHDYDASEPLPPVDKTQYILINQSSRHLDYIAAARYSTSSQHLPRQIYSPDLRIERKMQDFLDESAVFRISRLIDENVSMDLLPQRLSELRRITSVFLQVREFPADMESAQALKMVQRLFDTVQKPLQDYRGRLRQIVFDDKGLTALMVWGLPPSNAMDHVLALFCSIALRDAMQTAGLGPFSIGVASGPTFTGIVGNKTRADANLFGRAINI